MRRLVFLFMLVAAFQAAPAARATTAEEAAKWLSDLGVPLADGKGYVDATVETVPEIRWVSFARVRRARLKTPDLAKLAALPKLQEVVFGGNAGTDAGVAEIAKAVPKLRRLWLFRSHVTDAAFVHVARLTELEALHLAGLKLGPGALRNVARLRKLRVLDLDDATVSDEGLTALRDMPWLHDVSLQWMRGVGAKGMAAVGGLRRLSTLNLGFAEIDDALPALTVSRTLRELYLYRSDIGNAHAPLLARLRSLRMLSLSYTAIGDAAMPDIARLPNLAMLHLIASRVTDAGIKALAGAKTLSDLDLADTAVTDRALDALVDLPRLTSLGLRGTRITDRGAAKLAEIATLKHVDLGGTRVTKEGRAALAKALPKARIVLADGD
ncbi:MAG: hypothetical protein KIT16_18005 [Rhodospirillaceae bacterium]|nr:hypothetical protein [Rhodospirillaceae bacterium]